MRAMRPISLILTVLTGFSGLVYEVAWQKYLATLLGSHSEATAAVLAIFLGGMALGYELFGRVAQSSGGRTSAGETRALIRIYAGVELAIGVWALLFPWLFGAAQRISFLVPPGHEALAFGFDILLCTSLLGPPTVLMGGTIPLLTQALSRSVAESTRVHAWIYAANTAGAFAGALAGGFVLVAWLGLDGVLRAMGAVNLIAGAIFALQSRASTPLPDRSADENRTGQSAETSVAPSGPTSVAPYAWIAFLGGFAMMAMQTVANRIGALSLGSSHFTFAMIAALFVFCIALGSFAVSALRTIPRGVIIGSQWALVASATALYFAVPRAPYAAHVLRSLFRDERAAFGVYYSATFAALFLLMAIPISLSGALLPLLFHHLRERRADLGRIAGRLYSANTIGSLCGALLGGYVLLFWLDLADVYRVALAALVLAAALSTTTVLGGRPNTAGILACIAFIGIAFTPSWDPTALTAGAFRIRAPRPETFLGFEAFHAAREQGTKLIFHRDDPVSTISVRETMIQGIQTRTIVNNGKSDGNTLIDYATMCHAALIPALVTDDRTNSFVIGWGTGISAGELARLTDTERVRTAEISPGVIEAAPLFVPWNLDADTNPKVVLERRDAYRALLRSDERYGVILSEPSNPWVTGVEMLFSREFLEAARGRLTPGGVYVQWIHGYETDAATLAIVLQTYAMVFERVSAWFTSKHDVLLIGLNDARGYPATDVLRSRMARSDFREGFERCGVGSFEELAAHEILPLGTLVPEPDRAPHTLRHPILSHVAARAFFLDGEATVPTLAGKIEAGLGPERGLLTGAPRFDDATLSDVTLQVCRSQRPIECATWQAYWSLRFPDSKLRAAAANEYASVYGADPDAEWGLIAELRALYRGEVPSYANTTPIEVARWISELYARHFVHAIPFPRTALRRAWLACRQSSDVEACPAAHHESELRLTSLAAGPES